MNWWGKHPAQIENENRRAQAAKALGQHYASVLDDVPEPSLFSRTWRAILSTTIGGVLMAAILLVALLFAAKF